MAAPQKRYPPTLFFFWQKDGSVSVRLLGKDEDYKHQIFEIPLADNNRDMGAIVVGRSSEADLAQVARERSQECERQEGLDGCSARRLFKYGYYYAPRFSRSLYVVTDDDDIVNVLKPWHRIYLNGICSNRPSECILQLQKFEKLLKYHLLQQKEYLPPATVTFMESWGDGPMISHWNLYSLELQLFHPNPANFISVPADTMSMVIKFLEDARINDIADELWICVESAAAMSSKAKLQLLEDDIELPRRIQERSHQPTLFFYRNDDGCLQAELLENGTDTKTVHEIVHIPLVNTDGEEEASVIGRSSEDPLRTGINRAGKVEKSAMDEGNVCSARRVLKYGVQYSPNDARSTNVATNEDDIADLLKRFTRIFLNAISSYKPSECLEKLANFEEVLRDHLMQQKKFFPPSTVKYMESWGDGPMIGDWNLLALELQLPHPNPAHYISVPMSTFQNLMEILIYDENANQLVDELDLCAESAKALLAKAQLQARPAVNPFWFSKEKMMKKGKVAKAVELVKVGHSELDAAAQMGIPRRTVELEMKKDGVKSKFRPGRQPSTRYTSTQMTAAVELVREGKTYDEARSPFKIPKQSLQDACKRLGVKSARAYKKNRL